MFNKILFQVQKAEQKWSYSNWSHEDGGGGNDNLETQWPRHIWDAPLKTFTTGQWTQSRDSISRSHPVLWHDNIQWLWSVEQRGKRVKTEAGYEISVSTQAGDSEVRKRRLGADLFRSGELKMTAFWPNSMYVYVMDMQADQWLLNRRILGKWLCKNNQSS